MRVFKVRPVTSSSAPRPQRSGAPLDATTRHAMEARFRHDFGSVRVHADTESAAAAEVLGARAFTIGRHIVFGQGEYAPSTREGSRLLAHELGHVVEQGGRPSAIQCKLVDQKGDEIKLDLTNVKPGDTLDPVFGSKASGRVMRQTRKIVNAMAKTPSGLARLQSWVDLPEGIRLSLTSEVLYGEDGEPVHGLSDDESTPGVTKVTISTAQLPEGGAKKDRYEDVRKLEPLIGAVGTHESGHQTKENLVLSKQRDALAGIEKKTPEQRKELKNLNKNVEIDPVRLELTYLIEYDVLYPDKPSEWLSRNFEKFLGKPIYQATVTEAVTGLVSGGYLDASQQKATIERYLLHKKASRTKK